MPNPLASRYEQFGNCCLSTTEDGVRGITATIDRKVKVFVYEASIRRHLKLEDSDGISSLPTAEIFEQLALMGAHIRPESSPSRITSSPSLSPQTHPSTSQPPSTPQSNQTTPVTEEAAPMPHESPLQSVHSLDVMRLIKRVKKLKQTIKISQARRRAKVVISDAKEDEEDPSKQGRSLIEELDLDARISLLGIFSAATALADAARRRQSVENVQTYTRRSRLLSSVDVSTASELGGGGTLGGDEIVDGVFKGAFGALGEETWYCGDGVVVSSCVRSINNLFGGIMLIFGLLEEVA
ncbi:hypothetical protein Tco_0133407 [Tanacetum coccineum]